MENLTEGHLALLRRAITNNGEEGQWNMVQEEFAECIAAINQYRRLRVDMVALLEEVADAYIMAEQARQMLGTEAVDSMVEKKLDRLARQLTALGK